MNEYVFVKGPGFGDLVEVPVSDLGNEAKMRFWLGRVHSGENIDLENLAHFGWALYHDRVSAAKMISAPVKKSFWAKLRSWL